MFRPRSLTLLSLFVVAAVMAAHPGHLSPPQSQSTNVPSNTTGRTEQDPVAVEGAVDREDVGSAVYDERVGLSRTTGEVTHVTSPDVDAERDYLFHDLEQTKDLAEFFVVDDFQKVLEGVNGGGDRWHTDGKLCVGVIAAMGPT